MEITTEHKHLYSSYFKTQKEFEKAFLFDASLDKQMFIIKLLKVAIENADNANIKFELDSIGTIQSLKYEIHFAVLPTGDFVYYTVNNKTKVKGNYSRVSVHNVVLSKLNKFGVINATVTLERLLSQSKELLKKSLIYIIDEEYGYVSIDVSIAKNIEFEVVEGYAKILFRNEYIEELTVGSFSFRIYNSLLASNWAINDAADAYAGDEKWLVSNFTSEFEIEVEKGLKFLTLDQISIDQLYRNKGIGTKAIKELMKLCEFLGIQYIVLKPAPIEEVDFKEENQIKRKNEINRLVSFYKKLGFIKFQQPNKEPFMVFDVDDFFED